MKHRRMAWTACVVAITTLGLSGILAEGCGGDDNAPPGGTAGSGGSAGSAGSSNTGGGGSGGSSAGTASTGGSAGGSMDSGIDARAFCSAAIMTGSDCVNACICDVCPTQAAKCFGDPACSNLVACANRNGCVDPDATKALMCAQQHCPGELAEAGTAQLTAATQFGNCVAGANCPVKCTPEGGADSGDAKPDTTTSDTGTPDVTSDTTTTDTTTTDTTTTDTTTTDTGSDAAPE